MSKVYSSLDVARYIINYYIDAGVPVTNLKLQKLLYYIQAGFLVELKRPCFDNDIVNWRLGPVVVEVYQEYKCYGNRPIDAEQKIIKQIDYNDFTGRITLKQEKFNEEEIFSEEDILELNSILKPYIDMSSFELVNRTHDEDPWLKTKQNDIITHESIISYFTSEKNKHRIKGG